MNRSGNSYLRIVALMALAILLMQGIVWAADSQPMPQLIAISPISEDINGNNATKVYTINNNGNLELRASPTVGRATTVADLLIGQSCPEENPDCDVTNYPLKILGEWGKQKWIAMYVKKSGNKWTITSQGGVLGGEYLQNVKIDELLKKDSWIYLYLYKTPPQN